MTIYLFLATCNKYTNTTHIGTRYSTLKSTDTSSQTYTIKKSVSATDFFWMRNPKKFLAERMSESKRNHSSSPSKRKVRFFLFSIHVSLILLSHLRPRINLSLFLIIFEHTQTCLQGAQS